MSYNGEIAIDLDSHIVERPTASDAIARSAGAVTSWAFPEMRRGRERGSAGGRHFGEQLWESKYRAPGSGSICPALRRLAHAAAMLGWFPDATRLEAVLALDTLPATIRGDPVTA